MGRYGLVQTVVHLNSECSLSENSEVLPQNLWLEELDRVHYQTIVPTKVDNLRVLKPTGDLD